jgi:hypothetical protein
MPRSAAELVGELDALIAATADALARLHEGDERGITELIERRERWLSEVLAGLASSGDAGVASAEASDASRRLEALNAEIVALLRARRSAVAHRLERLASTRRTLQSYGAVRQKSAIYFERMS